jgi:hypothetical protein
MRHPWAVLLPGPVKADRAGRLTQRTYPDRNGARGDDANSQHLYTFNR